MTYSLSGAKLIPGQIAFETTRTGRLPSLQPLVEAGLPIAPYIEHGSWATGRPDLMRYGRDPYRGLGQTLNERADAVQDEVGQATSSAIATAIHQTLAPAAFIGTGVAVGAAAGAIGGLMGKTLLGGLVGGAGGGVLAYLGWKFLSGIAGAPPTPASASDVKPGAASGLGGMLAVL